MSRFLAIVFAVLVIKFDSWSFTRSEDAFQQGYIVTLDGDTVRGWIQLQDHNFNTKKCVFKKNPGDAPHTYTPQQLVSYMVGGNKHFLAAKIENDGSVVGAYAGDAFFLECVVMGEPGLYLLEQRYFLKVRDQIVELAVNKIQVTRGGKTYAVRTESYKPHLQRAMGDCPQIAAHISNTALNTKSLIDLFSEYDECTGKKLMFFRSTPDPDKIKVSFMISPGMYFSQLAVKAGGRLHYTFLDKTEPSTSHSFYPSVFVQLSRPDISASREVKIGLAFYSGDYEFHTSDGVSNVARNFTMKLQRLEIPLLLKQYITKSSPIIFIHGGLGINKVLRWEDVLTVTTTSGTFLTKTEDNLTPIQESVNFLIGPGISFPIAGRSLSIESFYGWNPSMFKGSSKSPKGTLTSITVNAGITF